MSFKLPSQILNHIYSQLFGIYAYRRLRYIVDEVIQYLREIGKLKRTYYI